MIDPAFLEILRCPVHPEGPPLTQQGSFLICAVDGYGYRIIDGIPHMLPEDAVPPEELEPELADSDLPAITEQMPQAGGKPEP